MPVPQGRSENSHHEGVDGMAPTARVQRGPSQAARCASKGIVPATPPPLFSLLLLHNDCRAARADHQHAAVGADRFIIEIDADDRIGAQVLGLLLHFFKRNILRLPEFLFIAR